MFEIALGLLAFAAVQTPQASIVGVVRETDAGRPVAGADVRLPDLGRWTRTDPSGRFELDNVPAGPQHLEVVRIGYAERTVHALVPVDGRVVIDLFLASRPVEIEPIEVRAFPATVFYAVASPSGPDRRRSAADFRTHPMLAEPDGFRAIAVGPLSVDPESPSGVNIRGGRTDQTAYVLDGFPIFNPYHAAGVFSAWNTDVLTGLGAHTMAPDPELPSTLSGAIAGYLRDPGGGFGSSGGVSTSEARFAADGPLGRGGYVLGLRSGMPDLLAPSGEREYVTGETGDHVLKLVSPLLGGRIEAMSFGAESELRTARAGDEPAGDNRFEWASRSLGLAWSKGSSNSWSADLRAWSAGTDAQATWQRKEVRSSRTDHGLQATLRRGGEGVRWSVGGRVESSDTRYEVPPMHPADAVSPLAGVLVSATAFGSLEWTPAPDVTLGGGTNATIADGSLLFGPRLQVDWRPVDGWLFGGRYSRGFQLSQSLRSAESLARNVFPADLYVSAGIAGVPIASSDLGVVFGQWDGSNTRVRAELFAKASHGVLLPELLEAGPFSVGPLPVGATRVTGASLEVSRTSTRYELVGAYRWQTVRETASGYEYVPDYGAEHGLDLGVSVFPTATSLLRASLVAIAGRHGSPSTGVFEWEACNLLDRGCEFLGSPDLAGAPGGLRLPAYARLDLGARKHWHLRVGGRDLAIGVFGTVTNVLGRRNVLAIVEDQIAGTRHRVEMRPRAPLVVGLDWTF